MLWILKLKSSMDMTLMQKRCPLKIFREMVGKCEI